VALVSQGEWLSDTDLLVETLTLQQQLQGTSSPVERLEPWLAAVQQRRQQWPTPTDLLQLGVDVVEGVGSLVRPRDWAIALPHRLLRGRRLLLAPSTEAIWPEIPGLALASPLGSPKALLHQLGDRPGGMGRPKRLVLIGQTPLAFAWAQIAQRLGYETRLVFAGEEGLASWDADLLRRLQAGAIAQGIQLCRSVGKLQIRRDQGQLWVCSEQQQWIADQLLVEPIAHLDLQALQPELLGLPRSTLPTNAYLQTRHRRVFACPTNLGPAAAHAAGRLAARNALLWFPCRFDAEQFPRLLPTAPPAAVVGLTLAQARQHWGDRLRVLHLPFQDTLQAQLDQQTEGFCRLLCDPHGRLLGAQVIGPTAAELITPLALLVQQRLTLPALAGTAVWPSRAAALQIAAEQWALRYQERRWQRWWREELFIFWRSL
jgi:pyruvate/2-oxoglutarate dehydrogenase complex dihydrolipoamide dehydrogenase (E3) component